MKEFHAALPANSSVILRTMNENICEQHNFMALEFLSAQVDGILAGLGRVFTSKVVPCFMHYFMAGGVFSPGQFLGSTILRHTVLMIFVYFSVKDFLVFSKLFNCKISCI